VNRIMYYVFPYLVYFSLKLRFKAGVNVKNLKNLYSVEIGAALKGWHY
jgi:predicted solute-binding protein